MGTITENLNVWSNYDWSQQGDEWSERWGGTEFLWWSTIFPRICAFVPTNSILEIAPGFGRFTHYLKDLCEHLTVVDLVEKCIEGCKQRFASCSHITYHVNDGRSLAMIPDQSIDFVFSFDSLVHAESDVIEAYLGDLVKKLKPNGIGFIQHSNIGVYRDPQTGDLPFENVHWRAKSMTARQFEEYCDRIGLQCIGQEIINWGGSILNDCFSLFTHKSSCLARPNKVVENNNFMEEAARLSTLSQIYNFPNHGWKKKRIHIESQKEYIGELEQGFEEIINRLSGEEIGRCIPMRKLIRAAGFKIAAKPGFRWLYRFQGLGNKLLGG